MEIIKKTSKLLTLEKVNGLISKDQIAGKRQ